MNSGFSELPDDGFVLPMAGLFGDLDVGSGCVRLPDDFHAAPASVQLDLIADWQRGLARARLQAFEQLYAEVRARHRFASSAELAGHFQQACRALGQEWPPELAARLLARRPRDDR